MVAELTLGGGLIQSGRGPPPRHLVSSLLLRVEALAAAKKLTLDHGTLLRTLAWQRDFTLIDLYEKVWPGRGTSS